MRFGRIFAALFIALAGWMPAQAAARCTIGQPGATQRITIGDTGRSVLLHMPSGPRAARPMPLLFALHGSGGTGAAILKQSGLETTSDRYGFLLVAPDAGIPLDRGYAWNIPGVPTIAGTIPGPGDADDVAFIRQTIDWLAGQGCGDKARVYSTGLSGGGRMTSWLGCVASDRFAGIAPVVGLRAGNPLAGEPGRPDPATCTPARPMPVIAFAGDADGTNPVQGGGAGYWQYPMTAALARWAELNGCTTPILTRDLAAKEYEQLYTRCRADAQVVGRLTRGAGHVWTADNDAMWRFLSRHRR